MKKVTAILTTAAMVLSSASAVSAESAYVLGDVDMDGVITGHDTGMVSRYIMDDTYTLTDEQLLLADVDGDGEVTQDDADKLRNEMQTIFLGNVSGDECVSIWDVSLILVEYAKAGARMDTSFSEIQKNLADVDINGYIDFSDAYAILTYYTIVGASLIDEIPEGCYYYSVDPDSPAYIGDIGAAVKQS